MLNHNSLSLNVLYHLNYNFFPQLQCKDTDNKRYKC